MYCSNCGTKIAGDVHFCPECGALANAENAQPGGQAAVAQPAAVATSAKPKMALWKKILIGVVVFVVAVVGLAMFATSGLDEPVERQLAALSAGNIQAAYAETSVAFQQNTSLEQFAAFVERYPVLKSISGHSFTTREIENGVGTLKGTLTTSDGGVVPIEFRLVKENDVWKILALSFGTG